MKSAEDAFREYLKGKGLKFTNERALILREVVSGRGHFDPDGLLIRMRGRGLRVSKASIYRTLPLLVDSGLITSVEKTGKHAHYERTFGHGHHDHMLCMSCGRVVEFYSKPLEALQERLCRRKGFEGISHSLEIMGYCSECRKKRR